MFVVTIRFEFALIPDLCTLKENKQLCCPPLKSKMAAKQRYERQILKLDLQIERYHSILAIIHFYDA